jgi:hypothetical protein
MEIVRALSRIVVSSVVSVTPAAPLPSSASPRRYVVAALRAALQDGSAPASRGAPALRSKKWRADAAAAGSASGGLYGPLAKLVNTTLV